MSRLKFQSGEVEKSYRSINNAAEEMISKVDLEKINSKI